MALKVDLLSHLDAALAHYTPSGRVLVGYSGGLDSTVLLHLVHRLACQTSQFRPSALHIHHGLSPNADAWASHCLKNAHALRLPCQIQHVSLCPDSEESLEALARCARYNVFKDQLDVGDVLLTAHHQDDQAETFLLQLVRGAGPRGLSVMPESAPLGEGLLVRPLLPFSRERLEEYANTHQLTWIEDESNQDLGFDRNYIRAHVIPVLKTRWPSVVKTINRSARHCATSLKLEEACAESDYKVCVASCDLTVASNMQNTRRPYYHAACLAIEPLIQLNLIRRVNVVRYWIVKHGFLLPSEVKLKQILNTVLTASSDAQPLVEWKGSQVRRYRGKLYIMPPLTAHDARVALPWDASAPLTLPAGLGTLYPDQLMHYGIKRSEYNKIVVRFRQGGERYRPKGAKQSRALKRWMQESNIPPWQRNRIPLIYLSDELLGVILHGARGCHPATE